jgi:hypothetical protein
MLEDHDGLLLAVRPTGTDAGTSEQAAESGAADSGGGTEPPDRD